MQRQELVDPVPEKIKLNRRLNIPSAMGELGALNFILEELSKNRIVDIKYCFSPEYPYFSYIPAAVDYVSLSSELVTSYTPYQAEASQGNLQILFEFQSLICELTGLDIANASMYDHSTALAEALLMAIKYTGRKKVLIPYFMRKKRKEVVYTYLRPHGIEIYEYNFNEGKIDIADIELNIKNSAAVYVENPNYFGIIDTNVLKISEIIHKEDSLFIAGIEPISLGIIKEPASYGADIAVGEAQNLAISPFFGGPSLGILAIKNDQKLLRLLPGRLVGATTTIDGKKLGFVLALQTREQHVKREKATSNICTNESWLAVRVAIYLCLLGKEGLKRLAARILLNTKTFIEKLSKINGIVSPLFNSSYFRNFVIKLNTIEPDLLRKELINKGILFGKSLKELKGYENCLLLGINEMQDESVYDNVCKEINNLIGKHV
jgi:glycine dehydrogenase subunit 1